jgi:hypothetical protein
MLTTAVGVIAFRGLVDVLLRRMIPWPSYIRPKLFTFEPEQGPQGLTLLTLTPFGTP